MSSSADNPLAPLLDLPGVAESVETVRQAVDRLYGHRVMRRRSSEVTAEAALRGARSSAQLDGAAWALEEVRRRSDFSGPGEPRTVGGALRATAEAGQLREVWRQSPLRVLARLHLVAAAGATATGDAEAQAATGDPHEGLGRPRLAGETPQPAPGEMTWDELPLPDADQVAARLADLARLVVAGGSVPALVTAAVVHGELLALRPFRSRNGLVARAAQRVALISGGLDPKAVCPAEVGHAELGAEAYREALRGYVSGTPDGVAGWVRYCGRAVALGARESTAVCEAFQRGAA